MAYQKYLTFSYDDGVKQDIRLLELFHRYGLKGTFNLNSGLMPKLPDDAHSKVSLSEIPTLYAGQEVATHGFTHPDFTKMQKNAVKDDILKDKEKLSAVMGYAVIGHAYPYGAYDEHTVSVLKDCGIRYARTVDATCGFSLPTKPLCWDPTCHHAHPEIFSLIDAFLNAQPTEGDLLLYIWGHSYELDWDQPYNNWAHMEEICKRLSGHKDIRYVTNLELLEETNR